MGLVIRVKLRKDPFSSCSQNYSKEPNDDSWNLHGVDGGAIEEEVADEGKDGPADVKDIDNWQWHYKMHGSISQLIYHHNCITDKKIFVVLGSFEVKIDP